MAPSLSAANDKKFVDGILTFVGRLIEQLPQAVSEERLTDLHNEVETQISKFPNKLGASASARASEFDGSGTELWNATTRLRREKESMGSKTVPVLLVMTRVLAFLLLSCAHDHGRSLLTNVVRLIKIGLKSSRGCIEGKQYDLAIKVLERVVKYRDVLAAASNTDQGFDDGCLQSLSAEYYIVRTVLAWRQDNLSLAEHMYEGAASVSLSIDPRIVEGQADALFEIGDSFLSKKDYAMAAKWLERANTAINMHELDRFSVDANELRTSIINGWIMSLLGLKTQEAAEKAHSLVGILEHELGDKPVTLLLKLDLNSPTNDSFNSEAYYDTLQRLICSLSLNEANIQMLLQRIRELRQKHPNLACRALDALLRLRVLKSNREDWVERLLNIRIWLIDGQDAESAISTLEKLLSAIAENIRKAISAPAAHAAQSLLWKQVEATYQEQCYDLTKRWCQLAMHDIFQNSGETNLSRIGRKLLQCALAQQDFTTARDVFGQMTDSTKDEPLTRFLMYKIAIRCHELDFAAECLEHIGRSSKKDPTILYACVLDSQQVGNQPLSLTVLLLLLENNQYRAPPEVHFPILLRITISLLEALNGPTEENGFQYDEETTERLCKLFEAATNALRKRPLQGSNIENVWTIEELDWFSKNSYNIATKHISNWNPKYSVRLLACCVKFIESYPKEPFSLDLILRQMFCDFLAAIASVSLARGDDVLEQKLQRYTDARKHIDKFHNNLQENLEKLEEEPAQDLLHKFETLLSFDFEAACHLKAWNSLEDIMEKAENCQSIRVYEIMADCILSAQAPTQVMIATLKEIINHTWAVERIAIPKMAIYMRCLFQSTGLDNLPASEELLDRIRDFVAGGAKSEQPYPSEELEWIVTRVFNRAVDLYITEDEDACKRWADKAISIAHYHNDGGALEKLLQDKFLLLSFGDDN
ncbi:hypothetical protein PVAG01_00680 [Phlyctema vagabunda]|uniref:Protein ZIP4 homolog n=1 Tax=Phlyctema vagabunda TaxID=108571 RepID=A0ABR4PV22_9HELO